MAFPWTLQRYIVREMGKTFILTALGLTAVIGLGGGVLNMVKLGGEVSPSQLAGLLWLIIPISASLTLPIAALFSATSAYGRLAGDNEFVACRSGGINLYVLLLPTLILSLLCAILTFLLSCSIIPRLIRDLDKLVGADVGALAQQWLSRPGGIKLPKDLVARADAVEVDPEDSKHVVLYHAAFAEPRGDTWQRYGTARAIHVNFESETSLAAMVTFVDVSQNDPQSGRFADFDQFSMRKDRIEDLFPQQLKNKFLTLREIWYFLQNPGEWRDIRTAMERLRREVARFLANEKLWHDWEPDHEFTLSAQGIDYVFRAEKAEVLEGGKGIDFKKITVDVKQPRRHETMVAVRGSLEWVRGSDLSESGAEIDLYEATLSDGQSKRQREHEVIGPIPLEPKLVQMVQDMSNQQLLDVSAQATGNDPLTTARTKTKELVGLVTRRLSATIHERVAFSVSIFVLVVLGAVLAIILRGSHVVTCFGISFIPSAFILTTIVMGKQMTNNASTYWLGLVVMWGGIVLVALIDAWTLTRVLRR